MPRAEHEMSKIMWSINASRLTTITLVLRSVRQMDYSSALARTNGVRQELGQSRSSILYSMQCYVLCAVTTVQRSAPLSSVLRRWYSVQYAVYVYMALLAGIYSVLYAMYSVLTYSLRNAQFFAPLKSVSVIFGCHHSLVNSSQTELVPAGPHH